MLHLCLPGYSSKNLEFVKSYSKKLKKLDLAMYARCWDHWAIDGGEFDISVESDKTYSFLKKISKNGIGLVAKSVGNLVAIDMASKYNIKFEYICLLGLSIIDKEDKWTKKVEDFLINQECKKLLIQNTNDQKSNFEIVTKIYKNINLDYISKESDSHDYNYWDEILEFIN